MKITKSRNSYFINIIIDIIYHYRYYFLAIDSNEDSIELCGISFDFC